MKTSEFIRAAVDAHLSPTLISKDDNEASALCFVFRLAVNLNKAGASNPAILATEAVMAALQDVTLLHFTIVGHLHATDPSIYLGDDGRNIQSVRFMLAEFIALMLEDEGD